MSGFDATASLTETPILLERARGGDRKAVEALFLRFRWPLARFLHSRLPSSARSLLETEDLVQEVWTRVLDSLGALEYRGLGTFWGYLRTVGYRHVGEIHRRGRRRGAVARLPDDSSLSPPGPDADPRAEAAAREELEAFETAISGLSERERNALLLRHELDLNYAQVALECGYPSADAARMAIRRTMARVARAMTHGAPLS